LPRWREAFRRHARAARLEQGGLNKEVAAVSVVWLRLQPGVAVAEQLAGLPGHLKAAPLVVMSDLPEDEEALSAFAAGARGYCNTHASPDVLRQVAAVVLQGGLWIGESLMRRLLVATSTIATAARPAEPATPQAVHAAWQRPLTEREREVALAVAAGASNKEIARDLGITERTVKAHVGAVLEKIGVRDRLQLSLVVHGRVPARGSSAV
jgi:DNA-binding NarL/FixJ family response regulator